MQKIAAFFLLLILPYLNAKQPIENAEVVSNLAAVTYGLIPEKQLNQEFKETILIDQKKPNVIGYLEFLEDYELDEASYLYVKYALRFFKQKKASCVIVRINSLGGEIYQAAQIVDLFQKFDINDAIPLIAYIDDKAIGSAAMVALACRYIAINEHSLLGGAVPNEERFVLESSNESVRSYLTQEFSSLAKFYERNPFLAECMADPSLIVVEKDKVFIKMEREHHLKEEKYQGATIIADGTKLLTLNAEQMLLYGMADFQVQKEGGLFLTKKEEKSQKWPFEKNVLSRQSFLASIPNAQMIGYQSWKASFLSFLTHPAIASLLFTLVIVSFFLQLKTIRFNFFGVIALLSLSALVLCSFALQAISPKVLIMLILGISLILIEIFLIPNFGGVGILGIALCIITMAMLLLPGLEEFSLLDFESFSFAATSLVTRGIWLISSLLFSIVLIYLIRRFFSEKLTSLTQKALLKEHALDLDFLEKFEEEALPDVNTIGTTDCILRPIGKVLIDGRLYEAISYHLEMIPKRKEVVVVKHENGRLVVRENKPEEASS